MKKFVISLSRTPERLENFRRLNSHLSNFSRYPAVDGQLTDKSTYPLRLASDLRYSPGAVGCALSHINLWAECERLGKPITILEDDAVTHVGFDGLSEKLVQKLPKNWDLVIWGWNFDCPLNYDLLPGVTPAQAYFLGDKLGEKLDRYQELSLDSTLYRINYCFGTPGYAVSPTGAARLRQQLLPVRNFRMKTVHFEADNGGIDVALNSVYQKLNSYVCVPPLLLTPNDHSISTTREAVLAG